MSYSLPMPFPFEESIQAIKYLSEGHPKEKVVVKMLK